MGRSRNFQGESTGGEQKPRWNWCGGWGFTRKADMLNARDGEIETMMAHEKNQSFSFGVLFG